MRIVIAGILLATTAAAALAQPAPFKRAPHPAVLSKAPMFAVLQNGHVDTIYNFSFAHDGKKLVSVSKDQTIQIWDVAGRECLKVIRVPRVADRELIGPNTRAALSGDGNVLAVTLHSSPKGYEMFLIQLGSGRMAWLQEMTIAPDPDPAPRRPSVAGLEFSADGNALAFARSTIWEWYGLKDIFSPERPGELPTGKSATWGIKYYPVMHIKIAPDNTTLAASGGDFVSLHSIAFKRDTGRIALGSDMKLGNIGTEKVAFSPSGERIAIHLPAGFKWLLGVSPVNGKQQVLVAAPAKDSAATLPAPVFAGENEVIMCWPSKANPKALGLVRYDVAKNTVEDIVPFPADATWRNVTISPDGKRVAMIDTAGERIVTLELKPDSKPVPLVSRPVLPAFALASKGRQLAWTGSDGEKLIAGIDLATAQALAGPIQAADFTAPSKEKSAAGKFMAKRIDPKLGIISIESDGKELLKLWIDGPDWIVWTAEGFFAASPGGQKKAGWHVNNDLNQLPSFFSFESVGKAYHRPDIIALAAEKGNVADAIKAARAAGAKETPSAGIEKSLPPRAFVTAMQYEKGGVRLKVRAEATVKEQPIRSLRLLMDGKPMPNMTAYEKGQETAELVWTVELSEGDHQLGVLAQGQDAAAASPAVWVNRAGAEKKIPPIAKLPPSNKGRPSMYATVAGHAMNAPTDVEATVAELLNYLIPPTQTEAERAYAICSWMVKRIAVLDDATAKGEEETVDKVLKTLTATPQGFAAFFKKLCEESHVEAKIIRGYLRKPDARPGDALKTNHVWNAVKINGKWYLVDVVGHKSVPRLRTDLGGAGPYFVADPERFVFSHFPEDPADQMLKTPISADQFQKRLIVPDALVYCLKDVSLIQKKLDEPGFRGFPKVEWDCNWPLYLDGVPLDRHLKKGKGVNFSFRSPTRFDFRITGINASIGQNGDYYSADVTPTGDRLTLTVRGKGMPLLEYEAE